MKGGEKTDAFQKEMEDIKNKIKINEGPAADHPWGGNSPILPLLGTEARKQDVAWAMCEEGAPST